MVALAAGRLRGIVTYAKERREALVHIFFSAHCEPMLEVDLLVISPATVQPEIHRRSSALCHQQMHIDIDISEPFSRLVTATVWVLRC